MSYPLGRPARNRVVMIGRKFGDLTVLSEVTFAGNPIRRFLCSCICGNRKIVRGTNLRSGNTSSCGCLERVKHGHTRGRNPSPEYRSWDHMIQRCFNRKNNGYSDYGGRGITVCERWKIFQNFFLDMGVRPFKTSLDRINNNGNYEPANCRWASQGQQNSNRRKKTNEEKAST